jgi:hypothetical protein
VKDIAALMRTGFSHAHAQAAIDGPAEDGGAED